MTKDLSPQGGALRLAIEADDFLRAQAVLSGYLDLLHSEVRPAEDIRAAMDLLEWSIATSRARKAHLAAQLAQLKVASETYATHRPDQTWSAEG